MEKHPKSLCPNNNCDECFNKSFASSPKAKFWSTKNALTPREVFKKSGKKFVFVCGDCKHEFSAILGNISQGKWCVYCKHSKLCSGECGMCFDNSFASSDKVIFWSAKNTLTPREVFKKSANKCWFDCEKCGHDFEMQASHANNGHWCPYCSGGQRKICIDNDCIMCFNNSFASSDKAKYWSSKNKKLPREVFLNSNQKYWFDCDCGHTFFKVLASVSSSGWCPYCVNKKLCSDDCTACFDKSFASSIRAKFWSPRNQDSPRNVFLCSNQKFWFSCECGHDFDSSLAHITGENNWCPYCANKKLCSDDECIMCFNNSFASSGKAKYWSSKNTQSPREMSLYSSKKILFDCGECSHDFDSTLSNVTRGGNWCPYCANKKLCPDKDCVDCFSKSFASSSKAKFWSSKNVKTPREMLLYSGKKIWFVCGECGHEFDSTLANITQNRWCPVCKNKTEKKLLEYLEQIYPNVIHQARFDWATNPKTLRNLPYDFCLDPLKILIELDGPQHFQQIGKWESPELIQARDRFKDRLAIYHGYSIIRILQEDVFTDKNQWQKILSGAIALCSVPKIYHVYGLIREVEYITTLLFHD